MVQRLRWKRKFRGSLALETLRLTKSLRPHSSEENTRRGLRSDLILEFPNRKSIKYTDGIFFLVVHFADNIKDTF
jgi:hypothetical protein